MSLSQTELNELIVKTVGTYIAEETEDYSKSAIPIQIAIHSTIDVLTKLGLINYSENNS